MKTLAAATAASGILLLLLGPNGGAAPATSDLAPAASVSPASLLHPTAVTAASAGIVTGPQDSSGPVEPALTRVRR